MSDSVCGTCKYSRYSVEIGDFACCNEESDYCGIETEYGEPACEVYEEK